MQERLREISAQNSDKYVSSGFPPKIVSLLLEEFCDQNKLKCKILDIGCGKGFVGEYLKNQGFLHITGMDCSKGLLETAKEKKAYEKLEKVAFGGKDQIDTLEHYDKYDFVVSATMINNDGWDDNLFF